MHHGCFWNCQKSTIQKSFKGHWEHCAHTLTVQPPADGSKQQVAIFMAWWNKGTLAGFWEIIHHQSDSVAHIMTRLLAQANGSDYSLQALNGNCNQLCRASHETEEICCAQSLGLFQVIQDRLAKEGKAYSGWLDSETRLLASQWEACRYEALLN